MNIVIGVLLAVFFLPIGLVLVGGVLLAVAEVVWASWSALYGVARGVVTGKWE